MHNADAEVTARDLYDLAHLFGGVPATIAVFMAIGAGLGYAAAAAIDGLPAGWGITIGAVAAFILVSGSAGVGKAPATANPCQYSPSSCQLPSFHPTVPPLTLTP